MRPPDLPDRGIVVMGVSGSGKTTIASALARQLGRGFRDGDSFHSPENVAKMARGQPLTSQDREPWLERIAAWLDTTPRGIVACSALARSHRDRLRRVGPLLILHVRLRFRWHRICPTNPPDPCSRRDSALTAPSATPRRR